MSPRRLLQINKILQMKRLLSRLQEIFSEIPFWKFIVTAKACFARNTGEKNLTCNRNSFIKRAMCFDALPRTQYFHEEWRRKKKESSLDVILVPSLTPAPSEIQKQLEWSNLSNEYVCVQCLRLTPGECRACLTLEWNEHMSIKRRLWSCPFNWMSDRLWVCSISPTAGL